jgi:hypothetical protein
MRTVESEGPLGNRTGLAGVQQSIVVGLREFRGIKRELSLSAKHRFLERRDIV